MKQKMPTKRVKHYSIIVTLTVLLSLLLAAMGRSGLEGAVIYIITDVVFLSVVLYMLESSRLDAKLGSSRADHYGRIADWYGILCAAVFAFSFVPEFFYPAAAAALFLAMVSNAEIAITLNVFLCMLLCIAKGANFFAFASFCVQILIGAQLAKTMREKEMRPWGCVLLLSVSVCIPTLFDYLTYWKGNMSLIFTNFVLGAAAVLLYMLLADRVYDRKNQDDIGVYEKIIDEDYPYVVDIKRYSRVEYIRAVRAATICAKCAALIGANEPVASAAGFYYRLGLLEGDPVVENGVRLAQEGCFPEAGIEILAEYNGEKKLPSTRESAIVHMVDCCINKIEMLNRQNLSTDWNQDMVIYQTLNELSGTGIYDESGLSMNQFLKVREFLVCEETEYDNTAGRRDNGAV